MTLADAPDLLTVPEAAAIARVGRNAMYAAVTRKDVYACTIGRSVRIPKVALMRWLLGGDGLPAEPAKSAAAPSLAAATSDKKEAQDREVSTAAAPSEG